MKKLFLLVLAALAAATFSACGSSAPVNDAVSASAGENIENMSFEAASGTYVLTDMTKIGKDSQITKDSYLENTLVLTNDGSYTLTVADQSGKHDQTVEGTYEITPDGVITLDGGESALAAKGEKITCNGEKVVASGALGTQLKISMVYEKQSADADNGSDASDAQTDGSN